MQKEKERAKKAEEKALDLQKQQALQEEELRQRKAQELEDKIRDQKARREEEIRRNRQSNQKVSSILSSAEPVHLRLLDQYK
mmetsp:Transcript_5639/g.6651  ORF Transcript_5639/g.6651 Transcript_5639/m.6651 type:complete len:82 (+) Transcript_5639:333-578(+)